MSTRLTWARQRRSLQVLFGTFLMAASCAVLAVAASSSVQPTKASNLHLVRDYGKLPLSFEANQDTTTGNVAFLSRGNGFGLYVDAREAVLALHKESAAAAKARFSRLAQYGVAPAYAPSTSINNGDAGTASPGSSTASTTDVIRMQLAGGNPRATSVAEDRLPGTANYFLGNDPAKWRTNIATFAKVRYKGVYPGVDVVYYGNQRQLEYDFVAAPRANAGAIRLHFEGARQIGLDDRGDLTIDGDNSSLAFRKPTVYQEVKGGRKFVASHFHLLADNTVGFSLGSYDHSKALVIDPILAYSTYLGGTNAEFIVAVAADSAGSAYVTGLSISLDFPLTPGAFQSVNFATATNAVSTAFVCKLNPSGTALLYSTYLGGNAIANTLHEQGDYGHAIAVDPSGEAFITGWTYSNNFPVTSGAFQTSNRPGNNGLATGFVTKLNASGTGLLYSTYLGGNTLDEPNAIAVNSSGDAFVSGFTFSTDFPVSTGAIQTINKSAAIGGYNAFVTKLNASGSGIDYSTYLGGSNEHGGFLASLYWTNPIVVDQSGDAYVAGFSQSSDFPVTANAFQKNVHGGFTVTLSKLNSSGTSLLYSTYLGGSTSSFSQGLAVDASGNAFVSGYTTDADFPVTAGAFQTTNKARSNVNNTGNSLDNGFVTKVNPTGSALVYSTYLGGTTGPWGGDEIYGLALDSSGDAYVAGAAMSDDFPVTANAYQSTNHGSTHCCDYYTYTSDAFLAELNPSGSALIYSTYLGGSGTQNPNGPGGSGDGAYYVALGTGGAVYITGYTSSSNFPVTPDALGTTYHSKQNTGFVARFDLGASPLTKNSETDLTSSANPVVPGTQVTFAAVVAPESGSVVPTGNMVFSIDERPVATVALSSGKAVFTTSSLAPGAHYILASYTGNTTYAASGDGFTEFIVPLTAVITPASGTYTSLQNVSITDATSSSVIYYTLNGTTPSIFTNAYSAPFVVTASKTVKAVAVAANDANSAVATATYTIVGSPWVLAEPATTIGAAAARVNALVDTMGLPGSYLFHYGTSSSDLASSTPTTALSTSTAKVQASAQLSGLAAKTTYYYQVVVSTAGGTTSGAVLSFTTN